jgi:hypothetical protein
MPESDTLGEAVRVTEAPPVEHVTDEHSAPPVAKATQEPAPRGVRVVVQKKLSYYHKQLQQAAIDQGLPVPSFPLSDIPTLVVDDGPPPDPVSNLEELAASLDGVIAPIREQFAHLLLSLEGTNRESLEANVRLADIIQTTANRLGVAFRCPKCSEPARFRCVKNKSMKSGMFTFAHSTGTHTGTAAVPKLTLMDKPPHGLKSDKS